MEGTIAPTDSRYRQDVTLYEQGQEDEADEAKLKIEVRQRETRKMVADGMKDEYQPKYFVLKDHPRVTNFKLKTGQETPLLYEFRSDEKGYWTRRNNQDWGDCMDIWGK